MREIGPSCLDEDGVTALFADRAALTQLVRDAGIDAERIPELLGALAHWTGAPLELVKLVELGSPEIAICVDLSRVGVEGATIRHLISAQIKRRGVEMRLVLDSVQKGHNGPSPDPSLIKAVVRAHRWLDDIMKGRAQSLRDIAKTEGVTDRYVGHLLPLAFLAPDIVAAILTGTQPVDLTTETLTKRTDLSLGWDEQKALLNFE